MIENKMPFIEFVLGREYTTYLPICQQLKPRIQSVICKKQEERFY
jgi:hypothetical protein